MECVRCQRSGDRQRSVAELGEVACLEARPVVDRASHEVEVRRCVERGRNRPCSGVVKEYATSVHAQGWDSHIGRSVSDLQYSAIERRHGAVCKRACQRQRSLINHGRAAVGVCCRENEVARARLGEPCRATVVPDHRTDSECASVIVLNHRQPCGRRTCDASTSD